MVFEVKNGWVISKKRKIELTPLENRLLQVLSNNKMNSMYEIYSFIYPKETFCYAIDPYTSIRMIKMNLKRKLNLDITTIKKKGYKLNDTVLIDY